MNEISLEIPENLKRHLEVIDYVNNFWKHDVWEIVGVPKERFNF